jgi:hypothetical protein
LIKSLPTDPAQIDPIDEDLALSGLFCAKHHPEERRFSRTARTGYKDEFPLSDPHGKIVQSLAGAEMFGYMKKLNHRDRSMIDD